LEHKNEKKRDDRTALILGVPLEVSKKDLSELI